MKDRKIRWIIACLITLLEDYIYVCVMGFGMAFDSKILVYLGGGYTEVLGFFGYWPQVYGLNCWLWKTILFIAVFWLAAAVEYRFIQRKKTSWKNKVIISVAVPVFTFVCCYISLNFILN